MTVIVDRVPCRSAVLGNHHYEILTFMLLVGTPARGKAFHVVGSFGWHRGALRSGRCRVCLDASPLHRTVTAGRVRHGLYGCAQKPPSLKLNKPLVTHSCNLWSLNVLLRSQSLAARIHGRHGQVLQISACTIQQSKPELDFANFQDIVQRHSGRSWTNKASYMSYSVMCIRPPRQTSCSRVTESVAPS